LVVIMICDMMGNKVRAGKAGILRVLKKPIDISITNRESKKTYAAVLDEDEEVYLSTNGDGFNVTWWEGEEEKSVNFDKMAEAAEFFLEVRKQ